MQEPVNTAEIEDVLSSIRRLVSQDIRPAGPDPAPRADAQDTLVLTPDLRVLDRDMMGQRTTVARLVPRHGALEGSASENKDPSDKMHDPATRQESLPVYRLMPTEQDEIIINRNTPSKGSIASTTDQTNLEEEEDGLGDTIGTETHQQALSLGQLEQTILELEAIIGEQDTEWEPDGSEDPAQEAATKVPLPGHHFNPAEAKPEPAQNRQDAGAESATDPLETGAQVTSPQQNLGAPEADKKAAPDDTPEFSHSASEASRSSEKEVLILGTRSRSAPEIDDETLRDIIRKVVHEELQGTLGLRITRNVRKLVRREIHRALDSQTFD